MKLFDGAAFSSEEDGRQPAKAARLDVRIKFRRFNFRVIIVLFWWLAIRCIGIFGGLRLATVF